jgi:nucleotide-binding universal stress UspA family protein
MRDIVVGIDGSQASRGALDRALRMGQASRRTVRLVHAWQMPIAPAAALGAGYLLDMAQVRSDAESGATQLLSEEAEAALTRLQGERPVELRAVSHEGIPAAVLEAQADDAAVLVLGTRGRSRIGNALGTELSHLLHHVTCPVVVVPATAPSTHRLHRVVVGFDGSDASRSALRWAVEVAKDDVAQVVVLQATGRERAGFEARQRVRREVHACVPEATRLVVEVVSGHPEDALSAAVGSNDLLVVGSCGSSAVTELVVGSVPARTLSHPTASVAVVHPHGERLDDLEPQLAGRTQA